MRTRPFSSARVDTVAGRCQTCHRYSEEPVCPRCEAEAEFKAERRADLKADAELDGATLADIAFMETGCIPADDTEAPW